MANIDINVIANVSQANGDYTLKVEGLTYDQSTLFANMLSDFIIQILPTVVEQLPVTVEASGSDGQEITPEQLQERGVVLCNCPACTAERERAKGRETDPLTRH